MLVDKARSGLLIVDVQEGLNPVMADPRTVLRGCSLLLQGAARLEIPVLVSEQYPKGLGPTVGELLELAPPDSVLEKLHFSCAADDGMRARLEGWGRNQVVVAGIEAHVCVLQSVLQLLALGYEVFVVADATSSRRPENHRAALERMGRAGAQVVTVEMVLFEWLGVAGTPEFKDVVRLIR